MRAGPVSAVALLLLAFTNLPAQNAEPLELSPEERDNVFVYEKVNRSVVNISTRGLQVDEFFMVAAEQEGGGSGSVLDDRGHILTNFHVIEDARQITVTLADGSSHEAKLVGSDPNNDLAVLKIDAPAEKLVPITWGDSSKLLVGMRVFAIGNPFGLERTLTLGIASSLNRSLRTENGRQVRGVIQTDAAINPGNSGGPLLNRKGELVGVTTAIVGPSGQNSGIGLAIPSNTAKRIAEELIQHGRIVRADCGVFSFFEKEQGLLIARLVPGGPAEKAGLRGPEVTTVPHGGMMMRRVDRSKADLVTAVDGRAVKSLDDLLTIVESHKPGETVQFTILRGGQKMDVAVKLVQAKN